MANKVTSDTSSEEIRLRIVAKLKNPNVGKVISVTLKDGPQSYMYGTLFEIINPSDRSHHHWCLKIDSCSRTRRDGWKFKPEKSVSIDDDASLDALANVIKVTLGGQLSDASGNFHLVPAAQIQNVRGLLRFAREADGAKRIQFVQALLQQLDVKSIEASEWLKVFETGGESVRQTVAVTARLVEYKRIRRELAGMIADGAREPDLQALLAANPWLFGSEYSELLTRRSWTRDDRLDFMLRRTTDDYLEVIEIKTPFLEPLLRYDASHDSYAPASTLSLALGQVIRYVEEIERNRDFILAKDGLDTLKIRARLIIGRDGDPAMMAALRNLNGHLHRVEIITFDQLLRIADRVLSVFAGSLQNDRK
ncbi:MAG TPA: Shedu anti-phage system protein SduA domain-containing protein [Candidatus Angelobacter sp.]|nr:Shedu anti-phage system protein SduA domain-containing protein [Candidatus Angelobacter sp.]